jgi:DNA topoisomerase I
LRVGDVLEALNEILGPHIFPPKPEGGDPRQCPNCGAGRLSLKVGKFGAFIGCSNYPDCRFTRQFSDTQNGAPEASTPEGKLLGQDPDTGLPVTLRSGRFGPYVQLGDADGEEKPKRASVPRGIDAASLDLERALQLLALPREVGLHPETGKPITAGIGRYGPFILHDGTYANLPSLEEVFSIGINRAVVLLAEKKAGVGKGRFQRAAPTVLKELGEHPSEGGKVQVLSGRYGPYVKHSEVNATLPRAKDPATLSLAEAVELIAERLAKGPSKAKGRRKTSKGSTANKEAAVDKPAAAAKGKAKTADKTADKPAKGDKAARSAKTEKAGKTAKGKPKKVSGTREAAE